MPAKAKSGGRKKAKVYQLTSIDAEGLLVTDLFKKKWKVGKPVGCGGFGRLYQATDVSNGTGSSYVIKIEPADNGPLFSELKYYQRKAKEAMVQEYMSKRKLKSLGIPCYISSGQHEVDNSKLRFMVMPLYKTDLQKLFEECQKKFPVKTVLTIADQVLDALEYIHSDPEGYVHADIKASNLLLGLKDSNQVYLVDYGLAMKYVYDGKHKEYKEDPRKAHNGTIEFTSLDAHRGCDPSRRGDLEILGYCCVQWLCSQLPWETCLNKPDAVKTKKEEFMSHLPESMRQLSKGIPKCLIDYMTYVRQLDYDSEPDYKFLHKCFKDGLKKEKLSADGRLEFPVLSKASTSQKRKSTSQDSPSPKRRARASSKPSTSRGKPTTQSKTSPTKIKPAARRKAATSKPITVDDSSSCTSEVVNVNNSASRRKSLDPRAMKVLKKARVTVKVGSKSSRVVKPEQKVNLALKYCISPMEARAMREEAAVSKDPSLANKKPRRQPASAKARQPATAKAPQTVGKSPRVVKLRTTTGTQTSPGLEGLKSMKGSRRATNK